MMDALECRFDGPIPRYLRQPQLKEFPFAQLKLRSSLSKVRQQKRRQRKRTSQMENLLQHINEDKLRE